MLPSQITHVLPVLKPKQDQAWGNIKKITRMSRKIIQYGHVIMILCLFCIEFTYPYDIIARNMCTG